MAVKVSVINFKGGVGKTTLTYHLAAYLSKEHKVLLVDVDHQSSLSIVMLTGSLWEKCADEGKTCNRIFESFCTSKIAMPGEEIIFINPKHALYKYRDIYPNLDLVPAQFELDDTEIELASTTVGGPIRSEWEKRTLLCSWLDIVDADNNYDFIIFDCPPATKLVSQNALAASDYYIIPVIPDEMSSRGVTHFRNLVSNKVDKKLEFLRSAASISKKNSPESYVQTTEIAGIIPFMAKSAGRAASGLTNIHTTQILSLRRQWGNDVTKNIVKSMTGIAEAMNSGWPVWDVSNFQNVTPDVKSMMTKICKELTKRIT